MFSNKKLRWITTLLLMVICCLMSGQIALAAEEPPPFTGGEASTGSTALDSESGDISLFMRDSEFGFYIDEAYHMDGTKAEVSDPDNYHDFFLTDKGEDGSWSYTYNKNDAEYPFTLTLHNGFNHEFAIFNNTTAARGGRTFRIVVEGSAVISNWETSMEAEDSVLSAAYPVYVAGGSLSIGGFESTYVSGLTCVLLADEGAAIRITNGVELSGGSLWASGGTITVERGSRSGPAVEGRNTNMLYCYVDDRYPASYIIIDGQGMAAARFYVRDKYAKEPDTSNGLISVGLELENIKLEGANGERLYLGSEEVGSLSVYDEQRQQATYLKATNSTTELADKNKPLTVTFTDGQGGSFTNSAQTGIMMELPQCTLTAPLGKVFKCWNINGVDVTYNKYQPKLYRWMFVSDTTADAVWQDAAPTEIRYNANGGEVNGSWFKAVNGKLPYLPYPYRDGYDFAGWFTQIDGGEEVTLDTEFWSSDPVTIYAHWQKRSGTEGAFYGTGVSWAVNGGELRLTGEGAVPGNIYLAPWVSREGVSSITRVSIGADITKFPDALFSRDTNLEGITVATANPAFSSVSGVLYNKGQTRLIQYPRNAAAATFTIPATVTDIAEYALIYSRNLTNVEVAAGNRTYYAQNGVLFASGSQQDRAAQGSTLCFYPRARTETSYRVPAGTRVIGDHAFNNSQLVHIELPDGIQEISHDSFYYSQALEEINFPDGLLSIGDRAFRFCESLKDAAFPEGLESIGDYSFSDCRSLKRANLPGSLTDLGRYAFMNCTSLEGIIIPQDVRAINLLSGCTNLRYAVLGDKSGSIDSIFGNDGAPALTTIVLPEAVYMNHGENFQTYFPSLEHIYYCGEQYYWNNRTSKWVIPEQVEITMDAWLGIIALEDRNQTVRVQVYDHLIGSYVDRYGYIKSDTIILAAYDGSGKLLCVKSREGGDTTGLMTFDLPVSLSDCARFAAYAVRDDGSFVPLATQVEKIV